MNSILSRKNILITGGAGFIGTNLTRKLLQLDYKVNLIVRPSTNLFRLKDILPQLEIHQVDILDQKRLMQKISKINPQAIIHLATYSQYRNQEEFEQMVKTNIIGTLNLLAATKDVNYDVFINTGSSSEYGIKNTPMKETDSLEPKSFYAATKVSATLLCKVFSAEYKKPIVTLRPFSVYGPYEEKDRFVPTIMKAVIQNKPIKLTGGNQRRDFIYIDDIVDIYIKSLSRGKKLSGEVLNMGIGIEHTNDEVVRTLFKVSGKEVKIEKGAYPKRIWDNPHWVADISRTKKFLYWKPRFTLEQGLRYTYNWFLNE